MHYPSHDSATLPRTPYANGDTPPSYAPLDGHTDVNVLVVGGGVTGLSTALHLAQNGIRALVAEGQSVGWGASGRNSGHIPAATRQEPATILAQYGPIYGPRIIHASREAPQLVYALAKRHAQDADIVQQGGIQAAHTQSALQRLQQRARDLAALGYQIDILNAEHTAERVGSAPGFYLGSAFDPDGGTLDPLRYTRGLARGALAAGARIHENTRILGLERQGTRWRARTARGQIDADTVVLATNGYSDSLYTKLWRSMIAVRAYQFVTSPLPEAVRQTILPEGQGFTDTRRLMSGIRIHTDGRLHFSGQGPLFGPETEPHLARSMARIRQIFPQIAPDIGIDYWWSGWMAMNREGAWKLHEVEPGLYAALGCNGRGLGLGTLHGREIAAFLNGAPAASLAMPFVPVSPLLGHALHRPIVRALAHYYRLRDHLESPR